jgi:hypothetical protein
MNSSPSGSAPANSQRWSARAGGSKTLFLLSLFPLKYRSIGAELMTDAHLFTPITTKSCRLSIDSVQLQEKDTESVASHHSRPCAGSWRGVKR